MLFVIKNDAVLFFNNIYFKILNSKEKYFLIQKKLILKYQTSLITVSLNIPGLNKNKFLYNYFFKYIVKVKLFNFFNKINIMQKILEIKELKEEAGNYLIIVLNIFKNDQIIQIKKQLLILEKNEKIFNLVDLDIINNKQTKIERIQIKEKPRTCYLCNKPSKICTKNQNHLLKDLIYFIDQKIKYIVKKNILC